MLECSTCSTAREVMSNVSQLFRASQQYSVTAGSAVVSLIIRDPKSSITDYTYVLAFNPKANHPFVYYAVSVDFVGEYLRSQHTNDVSVFIVTALANNVEVRVAPSKEVTVNGLITKYGNEATFIINMGESLTVTSSEDLTGSRVTANATISFYSGHYCATSSTDRCSVLIEQIPPFNSWENSFVLHTNVSGLIGNMFKLISSDIGASVSVNCTSDGINYENNNYHLGFRQHLVLSFTHDHCIVNSDEDILVIQFSDGSRSLDTFMTVIPSPDQYDNHYMILADSGFNNYVALTVTETDPRLHLLLLNNEPVTATWESTDLNGYAIYYAVLMLPIGRYTLHFSGSNIRFGAILYGSNEADTYGLLAGINLTLNTNLPFQSKYVSIGV